MQCPRCTSTTFTYVTDSFTGSTLACCPCGHRIIMGRGYLQPGMGLSIVDEGVGIYSWISTSVRSQHVSLETRVMDDYEGMA